MFNMLCYIYIMLCLCEVYVNYCAILMVHLFGVYIYTQTGCDIIQRLIYTMLHHVML